VTGSSNQSDRQAQIRAHRVFDQIWKRRFVHRRCDAYKWLRKAMGLSHRQAHISQLTAEQCELLIAKVYRDYPKLRTRYSRLLYDDVIDDAED
jgi:hypothetical protein